MVLGRISHFKGIDLQQLSITGGSLITWISDGKVGMEANNVEGTLCSISFLSFHVKPLSRRRYRAKKVSLV